MNENAKDFLKNKEKSYEYIDNLFHNQNYSFETEKNECIELPTHENYLTDETIEKLNSNGYIVTKLYAENPINSVGWYLTDEHGKQNGYRICLKLEG